MKIICIAPGQGVHHRRTFHRFCRSLAQVGHRVELIGHADGEPDDGSIRTHNLSDFGKATLSWNLLGRLARNAKAYTIAVRARADLYIFVTPEFIPFALILKLVSGKPVIFDCKEDFIGYVLQRRRIPKALRGIFAFIIRQVLRFAGRRLDYVTVADYGTEQQFRQHVSRVVTIFNFPRLDFFPPMHSNGADKCKFDLVFHGNLSRFSLGMILDIDQQLLLLENKVAWYLLGKTPELEWFRAELKRRNIEGRFCLRLDKFIPPEQVPFEVIRARIGIIPLPLLPKYLNNIPQKLFEFMGLQVPVVLSDLPPTRPFIEESAAGIMVDPNDPAAYAKAIVKLLKDPSARQAMGRRGRKLVEQKYNWEIESKKLIRLVNEVTKQGTESGHVAHIPDAD